MDKPQDNLENKNKSKTVEIKGLLEQIQKKLQDAALTDLALLDKKNEGINNDAMEQDNNKDFFDFVKKLETDHIPAAKKLRVAYLYINLDEPFPFIPNVGKDKPELRNILEQIQKKLHASAIKGLSVFDQMNAANKEEKKGEFYDFIKKLELDPTETIQMIAKKLRVAYLYITLDEPKSEVVASRPLVGSSEGGSGAATAASPQAEGLGAASVASPQAEGLGAASVASPQVVVGKIVSRQPAPGAGSVASPQAEGLGAASGSASNSEPKTTTPVNSAHESKIESSIPPSPDIKNDKRIAQNLQAQEISNFAGELKEKAVPPNNTRKKNNAPRNVTAKIKINDLKPKDIPRIPEKIIEALTEDQIKALTEDQIKALTQKQINRLKPVQIPYLTSDQIKYLTPKQIMALEPSDQIPELTDKQIQVLTKPQIEVLGTKEIQALTPTQITYLTPTQIPYLTQRQIKVLTKTQIQALKQDQIPALTPEQIKALTKDQILPEKINALTPSQIPFLTDDHFEVLLMKENIEGLTEPLIKVLNPERVRSLMDVQVNVLLKEDKIGFLPEPVIKVLLTELQIKALTKPQIQALKPKQIEVLLLPEKLKDLTPGQIQFLLLPEKIKDLPEPAIKVLLTPERIKALTKDQIQALTPTQIPFLTIPQIQALTEPQIKLLSKPQIQALKYISSTFTSTNQIAALTPTQIPYLTPTQIPYLTPTQIPALTPEQIKALTESQIQALTQLQIQALTYKQVRALNLSPLDERHIPYFKPNLTPHLNLKKIKNIDLLSEGQIQALDQTQIAYIIDNTQTQTQTQRQKIIKTLTPRQLHMLPDKVIQKIKPDLIQYLKKEQIDMIYFYLTVEQKGQLTEAQKLELSHQQNKALNDPPRQSGSGGPDGVSTGIALGIFD